ncbi:hypothetical protein GCM10019016_105550 [Streptomyces prasinosporus]|uniref:Uncharacterized protein n=1 Tax=Streptomyces prasinosporus TaxID=68256 RepID=A0ABP6U8E6_9ACTN
MPDDPYVQFNQGTNFYQQGQNNYGTINNAENMQVQYTPPGAVADGVAEARRRWLAQQDELRRRDRARYDNTQRTVMRVTWWLLGLGITLSVLGAITLDIITG